MASRSGLCAVVFLFTMSCASYKKNIMFKVGENTPTEALTKAVNQASQNYVIQQNDLLKISVHSNNGEKLIDPNPEISQSGNASNSQPEIPQYLVNQVGTIRLPMVGELKVEGLTSRQAELVLQKEFEKFFTAPYVKIDFANKRVTVLGAPGGRVIPLTNENMRLTEILAASEGLDNFSRADNIRVLRQEKVFVVDFSTVEGYRDGNMIIEPGDVVYVEPIRRPVTEGLRDNSYLFTLFTSVIALITILTR